MADEDSVFATHQQAMPSRSLKANPESNMIARFTHADGQMIEITHTEPLEKLLGSDLLAAIKWWHSGSVKRSAAD
jgi:hypothetical protein